MAETNKRRIYVVKETVPDGEKNYLVRAASQAQAVTHIVRGRFDAQVATTDEALALTAAGVPVVDAGAE